MSEKMIVCGIFKISGDLIIQMKLGTLIGPKKIAVWLASMPTPQWRPPFAATFCSSMATQERLGRWPGLGNDDIGQALLVVTSNKLELKARVLLGIDPFISGLGRAAINKNVFEV